jgi:pimeloyl-ACP methyl ester carboxylesterase
VPDSPAVVRYRTPDGSDIAVHDLGGVGEPLLVAHATGFHAMVLAELARHLRSFHCYGLDLRAHGRSRAGGGWGGEWSGFAADVLSVVDGLGLDQPYAFGHSAGGAALLLAEEAMPGTFRQLYCYEPIVPPMIEPQPPNFGNPLSIGATRRRERFADRAEALANYASKPPLSTLHPAVLRAYVEDGFADEPDGTVRLLCRPEDEARVFAYAVGHEAFANLSRIRCPVDFACGRLTESFGEDALRGVADRLRESGGTSRLTVFEDLDHFGPMAQPGLVAASMLAAFALPPAVSPG